MLLSFTVFENVKCVYVISCVSIHGCRKIAYRMRRSTMYILHYLKSLNNITIIIMPNADKL